MGSNSERGKLPVNVATTRVGSRVLLMAVNQALADPVKWPHGPERAALTKVKAAIIAAREAELEVAS